MFQASAEDQGADTAASVERREPKVLSEAGHHPRQSVQKQGGKEQELGPTMATRLVGRGNKQVNHYS